MLLIVIKSCEKNHNKCTKCYWNTEKKEWAAPGIDIRNRQYLNYISGTELCLAYQAILSDGPSIKARMYGNAWYVGRI